LPTRSQRTHPVALEAAEWPTRFGAKSKPLFKIVGWHGAGGETKPVPAEAMEKHVYGKIRGPTSEPEPEPKPLPWVGRYFRLGQRAAAEQDWTVRNIIPARQTTRFSGHGIRQKHDRLHLVAARADCQRLVGLPLRIPFRDVEVEARQPVVFWGHRDVPSTAVFPHSVPIFDPGRFDQRASGCL